MRNITGRLVVLVIGCLLAGQASAARLEDGRAAAKATLMHDGAARHYVVRAPRGLAPGQAEVPLVLVLHGGGGDAANAEKMTGFTEMATREGFVVVYPEGSGRRDDGLLTWNAGHCCGHAMRRRTDDVGFIRALIDKLAQDYPIDSRRIYATGMSNGAMMTHRLGIELSDRLAAIAPVVGAVFGDEARPRHPVSAIMLNGRLDHSVPYQGGPPGGRFSRAWDGLPVRPALDQATLWVDADDCSAEPEHDVQGPVARWQYRCPAGRAVALYLIDDNGHAWPGGRRGSLMGDAPSASVDATRLIWSFFRAHPKPSH